MEIFLLRDDLRAAAARRLSQMLHHNDFWAMVVGVGGTIVAAWAVRERLAKMGLE
jgi:hypothetical protein